MVLTNVCLTDKVIKTEWDVMGHGCHPPARFEDMLLVNQLALKPMV